MDTALRTRIIRIGNSRGIRIPKVLLEQAGLGEEVEVSAEQGRLLIRAARRPREGWEEQFEAMAARADDRLVDGDTAALSSWDGEEWEW